MTLSELGREYACTAETLGTRVRQVEEEMNAEEDEERCRQLKNRLRLLRAMYRDTRTVALYLENYYGGKQKNETGIL